MQTKTSAIAGGLFALGLACSDGSDGRGVESGGGKFRATASATVSWTGAQGLNVRDSASTAGTRVDWLAEGTTVTIVCQTTGDAVQGNEVWDKLQGPEGFVADAFMKTGHADFIPGVPVCGAAQGDCGGSNPDLVVAGHDLLPVEADWIEYIGHEVVPQLAGSRSERLTTAARVAWWSLKEGVLDLDYAFEYSNCNRPWGDVHIGPVDTCNPGRAWQVGLSGSQVPWPYVDVEDTALALYPGQTLADVMWATAIEAGYDPSVSSTGATIVASTGDLRTSWLLRDPAVGFSNQVHAVTGECIDQSLSWCYGTGWDTSARYAPNRATAMGAIDDLYAIFDALAP